PKEFALMQNYPNPFNPSTTITYHLPKTAKVELKIYDVLGTEIATLANEEKPAGIYHIEFNLASGIRNLASGIFFYQLKAGEFVQTRKMNFIK
nr:T9SS type A sorting domain-containing protein [Bacteroidia bacterium]